MWCDLSNLLAAFGRVQRGSEVPGIDKMRLEDLAADLDRHMEALHAALTAGTWQPSPLLRLGLRKEDGSRRILGLPTVQDRVVIEALRAVLEHRIEARLHPAAYAFRHRRSAHRAVGTLQRQLEGGHSWVALTDIASFFDAIPLEGMLEATATLLADAPDGASIQQTLRALLQGHQLRPGRGLAQGSALSPALSNLYLTPLDAQLTDQGLHLVRYCDNLAFSAATEAEAQRALRAARGLLTGLKLTVKDAKTGIYSAEQGFPWLGFWITASGRTISIGAVEALRERVQRAAAGATQAQLRDRLLPVVRGWLQYYDAPLPAQADLGVHTATLRDLIAFVRGEAPPEEPLGDEEDEAPLEPLPTGRAAALLDEVDRLTTQGRFAEASQRYEAAMRLLALEALEAEATPEAPPEDAPLDPDDERLDAFIGLFLAGGAAASALEPKLSLTGKVVVTVSGGRRGGFGAGAARDAAGL